MPSLADTNRKQQRSLLPSTATSAFFGIASPMPLAPTTKPQDTMMHNNEPTPPSDDASSYRPTSSGLIHSDIIWGHATMKGFLTKHVPPVFSFTKNRKRRYVILADRFLYCFKNDTPTTKYRDWLELTGDSQVFVSDHLAGVLYCLEIRKPSRTTMEGITWFLQADDAEDMKNWLDRLKKTIQYLADHHHQQQQQQQQQAIEPITTEKLHFVHSAEDLFQIHGGVDHPDACHEGRRYHGLMTPRSSQPDIIDTHPASAPTSPPLSPTRPTPSSSSSLSSSAGSQHRINSIRSSQSLAGLLPPALPPPTSKLPPPPSSYL